MLSNNCNPEDKAEGKGPEAKLCLSSVPKELLNNDFEGLKTLCEQYGTVEHIHSAKNQNRFPKYFVQFTTTRAAELALIGIKKDNIFKMNVDISYENFQKSTPGQINRRSFDSDTQSLLNFNTSKNESGSKMLGDVNNLCSLCNKFSSQNCERCVAPYCSLKCQALDWQKHRHICFEMPKLISLTPVLSTEISKKSNEKKGSYQNEHKKWGNRKVLAEKTNFFIRKQKGDAESKDSNSGSAKEEPARPKTPLFVIETTGEKRSEPGSKGLIEVLPIDFAKSAQFHKNNYPLPSKELICIAPRKLPESKAVVSITYVVDARTLYLRDASNPSNTNYLQLLADIQAYVQNAKPLIELPNFGNIVLAPIKSMDTYGRAYVAKVLNPKKIDVSFLDFGFSDTVAMTSLKELHYDLQHADYYLSKVHLKDVPEKHKDNPTAMKYLMSIDKNSDFEIIYDEIEENSTPSVNLLCFSTKESVGAIINNMIAEEKKNAAIEKANSATLSNILSQLKLPAQEKNPQQPIVSEPKPFPLAPVVQPKKTLGRNTIWIKDVEKSAVPFGKNKKIIIFDHSLLEMNSVSCINFDDLPMYDRYIKRVQLFAKGLEKLNENYAPKVNELCLCKVEDIWYRAECRAVFSGFVTVSLLDNGKLLNVASKDLLVFPESLAFKIFVFIAQIKDLPICKTDNDLQKLKGLLPLNDPIIVEEIAVTDTDDDCLLIIPQLASQMASVENE